MNHSEELKQRKDRLLEAMLPDVAFDGWSPTAARTAAVSLGLPDSEVAILFPDGAAEMVAWFNDWADRRMLDRLEGMDLPAMKVHERVAAGIRVRLELLGPYREAVRRALAVIATPGGAAVGIKALYNTVDAIWYAAGDQATDFNFYTKRALLAGVYSSTTLYWLNDRSEGSADSWAFLDRRLADVMQIPKLTARLRRVVERLGAPLIVLRQMRR